MFPKCDVIILLKISIFTKITSQPHSTSLIHLTSICLCYHLTQEMYHTRADFAMRMLSQSRIILGFFALGCGKNMFWVLGCLNQSYLLFSFVAY